MESGTHLCPVNPVPWRISNRGSVWVVPHGPEDEALAAIAGLAPCTCRQKFDELVQRERIRNWPRPIAPRPWPAPPESKQDRRKRLREVLMRATMPALVRHLVPPFHTQDWVHSVRRRGLAAMFSRPELGEGVAYCTSIYTRPDPVFDIRRVMMIATRKGSNLGVEIKFVGARIPPTGGLTPECFEEFEPTPIDVVKAKMSLPEALSLKGYAKMEFDHPFVEPW
jgi:hypothetical protein